MKQMMRLFLASLLFLTLSDKAYAELTAETLQAAQTLTAKQILLQQIDTISLYLQTENIVYVPKYREKDPIQIKIFFLKKSGSPAGDFRDLALRHVGAFQKALKERLAIYTPELAQQFDADSDLEFLIHVGTKRKMVAQVLKGKWVSEKGIYVVETEANPSEKTTPVDPKEVFAEESKETPEKKCPAMIGSKKEKKKKWVRKIEKKKKEKPQAAKAVPLIKEGKSLREVIEISPAFKRILPL